MRHACGCREIAVPDVIVSRDHMHQPLRALRKERAYLTHQDEWCGQMLPFSNFGSCSELWGEVTLGLQCSAAGHGWAELLTDFCGGNTRGRQGAAWEETAT